MKDLKPIKKVIKENIEDACCGIYNTRNIVGDYMENIYNKNGIQIDICYFWSYFEVFGLTLEEWEEIENFYQSEVEKI